MITVREVMRPMVLTADAEMSIVDAAKLIQEKKIGSLLITRGGSPIGIITENDFTRALAQSISGPLSLIMSSPLFYSHPDADVTEIAYSMTENRIKKVPIIENSQVIGIVTQTDVIQHVFCLLQDLQSSFDVGSISSKEYVTKLSSVYKNFTTSMHEDQVKDWFMICSSCGHKFTNPEKHDELKYSSCPSCGKSTIRYDLTLSV